MMRRTALLQRIPTEVDRARWIDPSGSERTREHFTALLSSFNESLIHHVSTGDFSGLEARVERDGSFYADYAVEGAGMAYSLLTLLGDGARGALGSAYLRERPVNHLFSLGAGMGLAFATRPLEEHLELSEGLSRRAVRDGYGFYVGTLKREALCKPGSSVVTEGPDDSRVWSGYGRAIWFSCCTRPDDLVEVVQALPQRCHAPVWRGVGVAAAFTGGMELAGLRRIWDRCRERTALGLGLAGGLSLRPAHRQSVEYPAWARQIIATPVEGRTWN